MKKSINFWILGFLAPLLFGCGGEAANEAVPADHGKEFTMEILTETRTTQYFSDDPVPLEDINMIMDAGRNASSGMNMQPWHFSAIIDQSIIKELAGSMRMGPPPGASVPAPPQGSSTPAPPQGTSTPAPPSAVNPAGNTSLLPPSSTTHPKAGFADAPAAIAVACTDGNQFAAGLACGNMVTAARAIGYGVKIVAGGGRELNSPENRTLLGVPDNMSIIAVLIVGTPDASIDMTADGVTGASSRKSLGEVSTIVE